MTDKKQKTIVISTFGTLATLVLGILGNNYAPKEVTDPILESIFSVLTAYKVPNWIVFLAVVFSVSGLIFQRITIRRMRAEVDRETGLILQLRDKIKQLEVEVAKAQKAMREAELKLLESHQTDDESWLSENERAVLLSLCDGMATKKQCYVEDLIEKTALSDTSVRAQLASLERKCLIKPLKVSAYAGKGYAYVPTREGYITAEMIA
ncbi:helix-turn-helix domain-containing protein [Metapseudomonas otitidis]|uniref:hypothetical protein n=1 Tax=Metapseudomonas otitidis TaxID=319939 RepID=UPI0013F62AA6|nr:hypothetical protein [Pseudomonas otitidis]